jgi:AbrB family looped-hinge helix DNA binding protein
LVQILEMEDHPILVARPTGERSGRIRAMITTIDAAGRLVIPREIRREAALEPGASVEVRWRDGLIEVEPQPLRVTLERKGKLLVATPAVRVPKLRAAVVERARRDLAERRRSKR